MTHREYVKARAGDVVVTRVEVTNGYMSIPAGTTMTVVRKHNGFDLRGSPCAGCGVTPYISRVGWHDVDRGVTR